MYISQVKLRNFRNFQSLDLDFSPGKNVIAGKNNSGKSNIIRAINYVLGEKYPTYINVEPTDFHATCPKNSNEPQYASSFTIYVQLKNLDCRDDELSEYKSKIGYVPIPSQHQDPSEPIFDEDNQDIDDDYLYSDEKYQYKRKWWLASELLSKIRMADSVSVYLHVKKEEVTREQIIYYGIILSINKEKCNYLISTISKFLRDLLITSAIIQAIRSPNTDLRINNYSWYSKMLKKQWSSSEAEEFLDQEYQDLQKKAGNILKSLTSEISDEVARATNVDSVEFKIAANNIDELYKAAKICIKDDANFETILENMGTGTQSHVIISLFSRYCQTIHRSGTLLAIEEPECYLHPHARRTLSSYLDSFVQKNPMNQIILTTHSIEFLKDAPLENIHILRKDGSGASKVFSISKKDDSIEGYTQKIRIIINQDAEMFFADCVILVEGGEKYLLPLIADLEREDGQSANPLDQNNISVVGVGGKSKFRAYISLLKGLDIPYYIIADLDMLKGPELQQMKGYTWSINGIQREEILPELAKIIKEQSHPNKKDLKRELCNALETACSLGVVTDELKTALEALKSYNQKKGRILKECMKNCNITLPLPLEEGKCMISAQKVMDTLFDKEHIFILPNGELEDYYKLPKVQEIKRQGKEETARGIADVVLEAKYTHQGNIIGDYLDVSDYKKAIQGIIQQCHGRKDK